MSTLRQLFPRVQTKTSRVIGTAGAVRAAGIVGAFFVAMFLARTLGPEGYGVYSVAVSYLALLLIPGALGMDPLLVREVARIRAQSAFKEEMAAAFSWWGAVCALFASSVIAGLAIAIAAVIIEDHTFRATLIIVFASLPMMAFSRTSVAVLRAYRRIVAADIVIRWLPPTLLAIFCGSVYFALPNRYGPIATALGFLMGATVTALTYLALLHRTLGIRGTVDVPKQDRHKLIPSIAATVTVSSLWLITLKTDLLMLSAIKGDVLAGKYAVAMQITHLITFVPVLLSSALGPAIAGYFSAGDRNKVLLTFLRIVGVSGFAALIYTALLWIAGKNILSLWGPEYVSIAGAMQLLALSQIINSIGGPGGTVATLIRRQGPMILCLSVSAISNLVLNAILIPRMGALGAALSTTISVFIWNLGIASVLFRTLKARPRRHSQCM